MSEPPQSELVGVGVDAPEAPGQLHLGQAAAEPTSGLPQVPSEDPLIIEIEIDDGEAPQLPASSDSQAAPTVTTGGVVGASLQQRTIISCTAIGARVIKLAERYRVPTAGRRARHGSSNSPESTTHSSLLGEGIP
jgi:hypothetical protein